MTIPDKCIIKKNSKYLSVKENKRKFKIINQKEKEILKIKIDGCTFQNNEAKRCDYFFDIEKKKQFFVELKGKNIEKAFSN